MTVEAEHSSVCVEILQASSTLSAVQGGRQSSHVTQMGMHLNSRKWIENRPQGWQETEEK